MISLTARQRLTYAAHLFKAIFKTYHQPLDHLLKQLIPQDGVVIDVGGHSGQFTKVFSRLARKGHVYTFEPGDYAYSILKKTQFFHQWHNVTLIQKGLSATTESQEFHIPLKNSGSIGFGISHIAPKKDQQKTAHHLTQSIQTMRLDDFITAEDLTRVDFIKIDIEGHEWQALQGMKETLTRFKPAVMVELNATFLSRFDASATDVFAYFKDLGYAPYLLNDKQGTLSQPDTFINGDYLFIHTKDPRIAFVTAP